MPFALQLEGSNCFGTVSVHIAIYGVLCTSAVEEDVVTFCAQEKTYACAAFFGRVG